MKFEFEKIDAEYIKRKVVEEEKHTGKQVRRVKLNRGEWFEFANEVGMGKHMPSFARPEWFAYRIPILPRLSAYSPSAYDDAAEATYRTVEVVPDFT